MFIVEHEDGEQTGHIDRPGTAGVDEGADWIELPEGVEIDLATHHWDFATGTVVARLTPEAARDQQWERAKEYRDLFARSGFEVTGIGVVQTRDMDREAITRLAKRAEKMLAAGETDWTATFKNEANEPITVSIAAILFVDDAVDTFLAAIHDRSQEIRDELDAALAAGATADQILAINITAGYPTDPVSPPLPPSEPES